MVREAEALRYHERGRHGKIEVVATKPCVTPRDLALAYVPGMGAPCRAIAADASRAFELTAKGNLVAVLTNGTAVAGLGDIGAQAAKPAMEGKAVLFKRFADIDAFDIELDSRDPQEVVRVARLLAPTFGGIDLEGIRAPDCFIVQEALEQALDIPVFHNGQHGTAIISAAALLNGLELAGKRLEQARVVIVGAGTAGLGCAELYTLLGVLPEHLVLCDSRGVVHADRAEGMHPYKARFASATPLRTLEQALQGADVVVGVSAPGVLTADMLRSMAERPVVLALAAPEPEIGYAAAREARPDAIVATGRAEHPNQVDDVLGSPSLFRGALDTRATSINREMRVAAVQALAALVREEVPEQVRSVYVGADLTFGPEYILPKPLDPRVLLRVAPAVARAAVATGVARQRIDLQEYPIELERRLGHGREVVRRIYTMAAREPCGIVFPEGEDPRILRACQIILDEGVARPILLGAREVIEERAREEHLDLSRVRVVSTTESPLYMRYCEELFRLRHRKGVTRELARSCLKDPNYFGAMMVHMGDADGLLSGLTMSYPQTLRPALEVISRAPGRGIVAGLFLVVLKSELFFLADTTVNIEPGAEQLVEIALLAAEFARALDVEPRVALLSFSDFGSVRHPLAHKVGEAARMLREREPRLQVDGEMQADTAVEPSKLTSFYPFSRLQSRANVLVFPDLQSGNIACKLLQRLGGTVSIGPILMGLEKPVHVLERGCSVDSIVQMAAVAALEAQRLGAGRGGAA